MIFNHSRSKLDISLLFGFFIKFSCYTFFVLKHKITERRNWHKKRVGVFLLIVLSFLLETTGYSSLAVGTDTPQQDVSVLYEKAIRQGKVDEKNILMLHLKKITIYLNKIMKHGKRVWVKDLHMISGLTKF